MYQDYKELLFAFNEHKVKYLVVGGYAVSFYAEPRATKGLDLFIQPTLKNAKSVYRALAKFGAPVDDISPEDFSSSGSFFRMGHPPIMVDILTDIGGVDFAGAWKRRVVVTVDAKTGLKAFFIAQQDLIAAKLFVGRRQDLADVEAVRYAHAGQLTQRKRRKRSSSRYRTK